MPYRWVRLLRGAGHRHERCPRNLFVHRRGKGEERKGKVRTRIRMNEKPRMHCAIPRCQNNDRVHPTGLQLCQGKLPQAPAAGADAAITACSTCSALQALTVPGVFCRQLAARYLHSQRAPCPLHARTCTGQKTSPCLACAEDSNTGVQRPPKSLLLHRDTVQRHAQAAWHPIHACLRARRHTD